MRICPLREKKSIPTNRFDGFFVLVGGLVRQWEAVGDFKNPIEIEAKDQSVGIRAGIKTVLDDFCGDLGISYRSAMQFCHKVDSNAPDRRSVRLLSVFQPLRRYSYSTTRAGFLAWVPLGSVQPGLSAKKPR